MANDGYRHDGYGVSVVISSLRETIDSYKDRIIELTNLVDRINGSTQWKDVQVKTAFISTCKSYISIYKQLSSNMENYVNYLNAKSNSATALENAFSG